MLFRLLQRVLYTIPVIWLVVSLVFLLIHLVPGDPIQQMLGEGAPPADSWRTLRGRHAWLTEEGVVLIEVQGDAVLITESLDPATTQRVEDDFWPKEEPAEQELKKEPSEKSPPTNP